MKLKMNCNVSINCHSAFGSSPSLSTSPDSRSCMTANVSISPDCCNECSCSGEDKGTQDTSLVQTEQNKPSLCSTVKRKKKRKRVTTICTTHCRYDVVRRIASSFGMREVGEKDNWNLFWTDCFISVERAKEMKRYQKVNHFPGMSEICRKDLLARNLNRMLKFFPKDYNFFPKTWCLPADLGEALAYSRANRSKTFILKPDLGCRGKGIFITKNLKELKPYDHMICQVYICKPLLLDGFKFDMRIYALITSCDPLRIFVYNDGLARFATSRYCQPDICNANNLYMHLTNYSVNKHSRTFVIDEQFGSKRRISTVNNWLQRRQYNVSSVWAGVDDIIIKTVISAYPMLKHSYHACFPGHDITVACFELLGFDILLDYKLKPYLLEVNHSPSFHTDAELDKDVKESLLRDTFVILNLNRFDKRKVIEEDKQRVRDRLTQNIQPKAFMQTETNISQDAMNAQMKWEENHLGNFRLIYPTTNPESYEPFFNQTQSTLFQDTFASRAREEALRLQREELEVKHRGEAALRTSEKLKTGRQIVSSSFRTSKLDPIKPFSNADKTLGYFKHGISDAVLTRKPKLTSIFINVASGLTAILTTFTAFYSVLTLEVWTYIMWMMVISCFKTIKPYKLRKSDNSNSFEPTPIVESEENERIAGMAQRDKLIRSCRVIDQVCTVVKKTGNIKGKDFNLLKIENKHTKEDEANKLTKDNVPIKEPSIPVPSAICYPKAPTALTSCARRSQGKITDALRNAQLVKGTVIEPSLEINTYGKFDGGHDCWHISKGVINRSQYSSLSSKNTVEKCNSISDLEIMCNEASITTRPDVPAMAKWPMILGSKPNKTHIVRHLSNTVKLHGIEHRSTFH